jgi:hypothetical protein
MRTKLISDGKRFFAPIFTAGIALAISFTLNACGSDDPNDGGGGSFVENSKVYSPKGTE